MSFGCERSCSSARRVSNFRNKVPHGGIYTHIQFEKDWVNIFRVRVFTSSRSTGGRGSGRGDDDKTIISPNTSFGDILIGITTCYISHNKHLMNMVYYIKSMFNELTS